MHLIVTNPFRPQHPRQPLPHGNALLSLINKNNSRPGLNWHLFCNSTLSSLPTTIMLLITAINYDEQPKKIMFDQ